MAVPPVFVIGLSHHTAPVAVREVYAFDEEAAAGLDRALLAAGLREAALLSTCNRTEVYAVGPDGADFAEMRATVAGAMAVTRGRSAEEAAPYLYQLNGVDAVRHLFRVAASLDSMVLGEPQILGQAKNAFRIASEAGTIGPTLGRFFERAFKVAKEVRTTTGVGTGQVSVGSIAVDLAKKVHGDLSKCTVLLLGAGKMAEAVAKTLASAGAEQVVVANRTVEKALKVAETYGWKGVALNDLPGLVAASDVVIASLGAPSYVLDKATMKAVLQRRRFRPVFLVDIAVPRVLDPEAGTLEGVYLYNIDDFNSIIEEHLKRRSQDVHQADAIVSREVEGVQRYLRQMELQPVIAELGRRAAETRDRELARALKDLGELTDAQRSVLGVLANSLTTKMIHDPVTVLRETAADGSGADLADAVRRLWRLEAGDKAGTAPGCGQAVLAGTEGPAAGTAGVPVRDEGAAGTAAGGEAT